MRPCHVALIGAAEVVGQEVLRMMEERAIPLRELTLLASAEVESEGTRLSYLSPHSGVRPLTRERLDEVDIAIFASDTHTACAYATYASEAGAVVIDCSGAFALVDDVPLCVPEVNAAVLAEQNGIIAAPHSVTVQTALALAPLQAEVGLRRVMLTTYQSVSGMGQQAMQEFDQQMRDLLNFREADLGIFPHQLAFNCVPQCGDFVDHGYTSDELALIGETRKVLALGDAPITATAVRVPLMHSHSVAAYVETVRPLGPDTVRDLLEAAPGVQVQDNTERLLYPSPVRSNGQDEVFVGRIRADHSVPHGLHLWIVADNLRRGAGLNVVQIMEHLLT